MRFFRTPQTEPSAPTLVGRCLLALPRCDPFDRLNHHRGAAAEERTSMKTMRDVVRLFPRGRAFVPSDGGDSVGARPHGFARAAARNPGSNPDRTPQDTTMECRNKSPGQGAKPTGPKARASGTPDARKQPVRDGVSHAGLPVSMCQGSAETREWLGSGTPGFDGTPQ